MQSVFDTLADVQGAIDGIGRRYSQGAVTGSLGSTIGGGSAGSYGGGFGSGAGGSAPIWDGYTQGGQRLTLNTEAETSLGLAYSGTFDGQAGNFLKQGSDYLLLDHPGAVDGSVDELVVTASRRPVQPFGMYASNSSRSSSRSSSPALSVPNYPQQFAQDYNSARNAAAGTLRAGWEQLNRRDVYNSGDGIAANLNTLSGGLKVVGGGIAYVASPITGAVNTIVGRPLETITGGALPREFAGDATLTIGSVFVGGAGATSRIGSVGPLVAETAAPRTFTSSDPLVANLANEIEAAYPGHVVGVNVPVRNAAGQLITDADIQLQNAIIQVKSGGGKGLTSQLSRTERATGMPTIGYGPTLKPSVVRSINQAGGLVTTDKGLLIEVVKP